MSNQRQPRTPAGAGLVIVIGPDTPGIPVRPIPYNSSVSVVTSIAQNAASVTLLAANTSRVQIGVFNLSSANLFLKLGATASVTSFTVRMVPNSYYELPVMGLGTYTGIIDGIWDAAGAGIALVTELRAP